MYTIILYPVLILKPVISLLMSIKSGIKGNNKLIRLALSPHKDEINLPERAMYNILTPPSLLLFSTPSIG